MATSVKSKSGPRKRKQTVSIEDFFGKKRKSGNICLSSKRHIDLQDQFKFSGRSGGSQPQSTPRPGADGSCMSSSEARNEAGNEFLNSELGEFLARHAARPGQAEPSRWWVGQALVG